MKQIGRYLYHVAAPANRERIEQNGIVPHRGEQWLSDTPIEGKAVFATNSDNPKKWFDSTYDDDIWRIDSTKIPDVVWYPDPNFTPKSYHVYTHSLIPREAIELIKKGSGESLEESKKLRNIVRKVIAELAQKRERVYIGKNVVREVVSDESKVKFNYLPGYKLKAEEVMGAKINKFLGAGAWGAAYSTTDGRVLKITQDDNEFMAAQDLIGLKNKYMVDIYDLAEIGRGVYAVLMEKITRMDDAHREAIENFDRMFDEQSVFENTWAELLERGYDEDLADWLTKEGGERSDKYIMSPLEVYENLLKIYSEGRTKGVELRDMHLENLGVKNGHLAALDLS